VPPLPPLDVLPLDVLPLDVLVDPPELVDDVVLPPPLPVPVVVDEQAARRAAPERKATENALKSFTRQ
jgi:hypothetical protein